MATNDYKALQKDLAISKSKHKWTSWTSHFGWGGFLTCIFYFVLLAIGVPSEWYPKIAAALLGGPTAGLVWEGLIGVIMHWEFNTIDFITFPMGAGVAYLALLLLI